MDWPTQPIGELCDLINGRAFKPSDWGNEGLQIVRIQNLNDSNKPYNFYSGSYADRHFIDDGEILLSWSGTPGTSFGCFRWLRGPGVLNQHIFKVTVDTSLMDGDFFIYAVNSRLDEMIRQSHGGVGLRHITKSKLNAIELPVPKLDEQCRIVSRIKECMERGDEIEKLRDEAMSERDFLLTSQVEALLSNVDGVPVELSDVCQISSRLINPKETQYQDWLYVGGGNIESKTGMLVDLKTAAEEGLKSDKFKFDASVVLYNKIRPYLVKVARPDFSGLCSADMYPLVPDLERLHRGYLFFLLMSRHFTNYAIAGSNRAGMPKVNRKHLFAYEFELPSMEVQESIAQVLDSAMFTIEKLRTDMVEGHDEMIALRESILRKAFAGEL